MPDIEAPRASGHETVARCRPIKIRHPENASRPHQIRVATHNITGNIKIAPSSGPARPQQRKHPMSIVSISRGCDSWGDAVAQEVAERLGYACISRDIVFDASEIFDIEQPKLIRAIQDAPTLIDRFTKEKERCVAYVRAALLKFLQEDDVVYHGLAGHFFIADLPQILKVRIVADLEDRIRLDMARQNVTHAEAEKKILENDIKRRKWGQYLFGVDTADPSLYDLVIHIQGLSVTDAADIICDTVCMPRYRTTPQRARELKNLALAAEVDAMLIHVMPEIQSVARDGDVTITVTLGEISADPVIRNIHESVKTVKGIRSITVCTAPAIEYN